jgi:glycine/serine hydroxymethyltransferase
MVTDMAHVAGLVAAGLHRARGPPDFVDDDAKDAARARGGMVFCSGAKDLDSRVSGPRWATRPSSRRSPCFKEASEPGFAAYSGRSLQTRPDSPARFRAPASGS